MILALAVKKVTEAAPVLLAQPAGQGTGG
jgi:hypothetical protein